MHLKIEDYVINITYCIASYRPQRIARQGFFMFCSAPCYHCEFCHLPQKAVKTYKKTINSRNKRALKKRTKINYSKKRYSHD